MGRVPPFEDSRRCSTWAVQLESDCQFAQAVPRSNPPAWQRLVNLGSEGDCEMLPGIQYRLLRTISPGEPHICTGEFYEGKSKLEIMLGHEFLGTIPGDRKSVV